MRTRVRAGVVAGVVLALVCSLPLSTPAVAAPEPGPGPDVPSRAQARQALAQVQALLTSRAPRRAGQVLPRRDVTLALRDLRRALPALSGSERTAARTLLAGLPTPSASCNDGLLGSSTVIRTAHFCVRYSGNTTEDWAQTTARTLEEVYAAEVTRLGFRPPPADDDGLFDVHLDQLADQGIYGYCVAEESPHSTSACVLDNDFDPREYGAPALQSLRATAAHEFFHAVQFGYDVDEDIWFMEGSAVWAEEQVYPALNDYLQYLGHSAIRRPRVPTDYSGVDSSDVLHRYGAVLFWSHLSERYGGPAFVRRVWELADGAVSSRYSLQAVTAALAARKVSFADAFALFGVWNTLPAGSYSDRRLYPAPAWWRVTGLSRARRSTGVQRVTLDHLTNAALVLRPARRLPKRAKVRIVVDAPYLGRMPRAVVQVRKRNGALALWPVPLNSRGDGSRLVVFDPRRVSSVVVTLTNASTRQASCGADSWWRFSCAGVSRDDRLGFAVAARLRLR